MLYIVPAGDIALPLLCCIVLHYIVPDIVYDIVYDIGVDGIRLMMLLVQDCVRCPLSSQD
jgi:hypothetical protein